MPYCWCQRDTESQDNKACREHCLGTFHGSRAPLQICQKRNDLIELGRRHCPTTLPFFPLGAVILQERSVCGLWITNMMLQSAVFEERVFATALATIWHGTCSVVLQVFPLSAIPPLKLTYPHPDPQGAWALNVVGGFGFEEVCPAPLSG